VTTGTLRHACGQGFRRNSAVLGNNDESMRGMAGSAMPLTPPLPLPCYLESLEAPALAPAPSRLSCRAWPCDGPVMGDNAPLDPPYVVIKGTRTYYVAADGSAWRVRDTLWESRRHREVEIGSPAAKYRLFTNPDGRRQVYEFTADGARGIAEPDLDRQLRMSKFEPRVQSPDPEALSLGPGERTAPSFTDPRQGRRPSS
jgi:hypothetical protein